MAPNSASFLNPLRSAMRKASKWAHARGFSLRSATRRSFLWTTLLVALLMAGATAHPPLSLGAESTPNRPLPAASFDWDDTILNMPSVMILFEKDTGREAPISTREYAEIRNQIGIQGKWKNFEIRRDDQTGSFRMIRASDQHNYFLEDIQKAVKTFPTEQWQAQAWKDFVLHLQTPELAARTSIITARGQPAKDIYEGLQYLQKEGYLRYLPPIENIDTVGGALDTSAAKVEKMRKRLAQLEKEANGSAWSEPISWIFRDDDPMNIKTAIRNLSGEAANYPHVRIFIVYVGHKNDPEIPAKITVLEKKGTRPAKLEELPQLELYLKPMTGPDCLLKFKNMPALKSDGSPGLK